ncbi:hypothetical protein BDV26DRAFT_259014 [Aspergillus bertholletiae]|uniref:Uncharacterized protein n=1 Tax=Aspergillus bertholletiae TaxID=1226010 RepID=A0A5N7BD48_9EURO|nr:hypothetical protein BDV26DRAFT_259014 [Aspergillus bertholletiae]
MLFQNHQSALRIASLESINVVGEGNSWHSLIATLRHHSQPTRLSIKECLQDGVEKTPQGNENASSSILIMPYGM